LPQLRRARDHGADRPPLLRALPRWARQGVVLALPVFLLLA
jgi:hypothetical protein